MASDGRDLFGGKEFSLLTQWQRDTLLGKKTYVYEVDLHDLSFGPGN